MTIFRSVGVRLLGIGLNYGNLVQRGSQAPDAAFRYDLPLVFAVSQSSHGDFPVSEAHCTGGSIAESNVNFTYIGLLNDLLNVAAGDPSAGHDGNAALGRLYELGDGMDALN